MTDYVAISDIKREAAGIFDNYLKEQIMILIFLPAQNKARYIRAQTKKKSLSHSYRCLEKIVCSLVAASVLSIDRELDVALLVVVVVLQQ